tara:strand:- start:242 stop:484 length:243 start_codon:yes stop_codon:yes gene_type:complete
MKRTKKNLTPSLHGDILINTRSNKQPRAVIGYAAEPAGLSGGRVWRLHKNGSASWLVDTVLLSTAESLAAGGNEALGYKA